MQVQQIRMRNQDCSNCRSLQVQTKCSFSKCHSRTDLIHLDSAVWRKPSLFSAKSTLLFVHISSCAQHPESPALQSTGKGYRLTSTHSIRELTLCLSLRRHRDAIAEFPGTTQTALQNYMKQL